MVRMPHSFKGLSILFRSGLKNGSHHIRKKVLHLGARGQLHQNTINNSPLSCADEVRDQGSLSRVISILTNTAHSFPTRPLEQCTTCSELYLLIIAAYFSKYIKHLLGQFLNTVIQFVTLTRVKLSQR